ncbi:hypothetical protein cce_5166 [Crocosphaera subtropica ATCC 51142]|uniref:Uncharacterized protein n=1 Tax=Crocosphaera subtropica (strain ATCC 51142 / BH68) TaxID=43989 RepID=B1X301_CROS5|nr:hypothetical protein [Crocosphaera subtropica]ACB54512.1 hypothetical protein cce_5166 [Crocosphaera subtropica ATCC 51142]
MLLKETLSRKGSRSQSPTTLLQSSCLESSSPVKKTIFTDKLDHDAQQGWQQEAVGFGPFWSEYDMWL